MQTVYHVDILEPACKMFAVKELVEVDNIRKTPLCKLALIITNYV